MDDNQLDLKSLIRDRQVSRKSQIQFGVSSPVVFQKITLTLTTARSSDNPLKIGFPFSSVFVRDATDSSTEVKLVVNDNSAQGIDSSLPLRKNDSFDFVDFQNGGYLYWSAQSGATVTLIFSTFGAMRTGAQTSQVSGGFSITEGSSLSGALLGSGGASASVSVVGATQLLTTDTDRKVATLYFPDACWVGDASVAVGTRGVLQPAGIMIYKNTAPLYAVSVSGLAVLVTGNVEK